MWQAGDPSVTSVLRGGAGGRFGGWEGVCQVPGAHFESIGRAEIEEVEEEEGRSRN